jgi:enamine deaminase RidA (YjgF/YER057c/UK114 family)
VHAFQIHAQIVSRPPSGASQKATAALCETGEMAPQSRIELIRSEELTDLAPYAYAAVAPPGARLVITAGACPLDAAGETVAPADLVAQTEQVMNNLRLALRAAGAELHDVLKTTVYVATQQHADLLIAWEIVKRHFGAHDAPSTLLGVSALGYRDQLVEVEAVAVLA